MITIIKKVVNLTENGIICTGEKGLMLEQLPLQSLQGQTWHRHNNRLPQKCKNHGLFGGPLHVSINRAFTFYRQWTFPSCGVHCLLCSLFVIKNVGGGESDYNYEAQHSLHLDFMVPSLCSLDLAHSHMFIVYSLDLTPPHRSLLYPHELTPSYRSILHPFEETPSHKH